MKLTFKRGVCDQWTLDRHSQELLSEIFGKSFQSKQFIAVTLQRFYEQPLNLEVLRQLINEGHLEVHPEDVEARSVLIAATTAVYRLTLRIRPKNLEFLESRHQQLHYLMYDLREMDLPEQAAA